jgi:hypothetical protein
MPQFSTGPLSTLDLHVLHELVRFGVLTDRQLGTFYASPFQTSRRLGWFARRGLVHRWRFTFDGQPAYSPLSAAVRLANCGITATLPSWRHLAHDIAVADLARHLLDRHPDADWRSEREVPLELRAASGATHLYRGSNPRTPDGILRLGGQRLAIELEHSGKTSRRYARIGSYYAAELRFDAVVWYFDHPTILERVRRANAENGFDVDIPHVYRLLPPDVVVPVRARR